MMRLGNKVAWITGAGSGIGAAIALAFSREGAKVVCSDINFPAVEGRVEEIREAGGTGLAVSLDVGDGKSVRQCLQRIMDTFGRIDILVNNAGINMPGPFLEIPEENWDAVIRVNLRGYFLCGQTAARIMKAQGGGVIINIASITTFGVLQNLSTYASTKGAVEVLTKHMALELVKYNIRVNAISPGIVTTNLNRVRLQDPEQLKAALELVPMGRLGKPEEIAGPALFLASDDASYMTGSVVVVDGGTILK